jgi:ABC-type amino acid transport substrate-binding protein
MKYRLLIGGVLLAGSAAAAAAASTSAAALAARGVVRVRVRAENPQAAIVRMSVVEADTLRGVVQELPLPIDIELTGLTVRVRFDPMNRAIVTTTTAEFWYGDLRVTRGEVTGVGADIQVERGGLAIRTAARSGAVIPLAQQP